MAVTVEDLQEFDMTRLNAGVRGLGASSHSLSEVASRAARLLHDELLDRSGARASALVRIWKSQVSSRLAPELAGVAREALGAELPPDLRCLVLEGTAGDEPAWNDPTQSRTHRAIPLAPSVIAATPMLRNLIAQFGLTARDVSARGMTGQLANATRTFSVFHVARARGSALVPAQEFVVAHAIESVLGFGGGLVDGSIYAAVIFSRVPISRETANRFRALALSLKVALLAFDEAVLG